MASQKYAIFLSKLLPQRPILDVGSGYGWFSCDVRVDIDKKIIPKQGGVVADAHKLPFKDESFQGVNCHHALEHLEFPEKALEEFKRILAPGGGIVITTPHPKHWDEHCDFTCHSKPIYGYHKIPPMDEKTLTKLVGQFFDVKETFGFRGMEHTLFPIRVHKFLGRIAPIEIICIGVKSD